MSDLNNKLKGYLSFLDNKYVAATLAIFLILYAGYAAPKLPASIAKLFDYEIFKLLIIFLIAFTSSKSPMLSILIALAFVLSLQTLNRVHLQVSLRNLLEGKSVFADDAQKKRVTFAQQQPMDTSMMYDNIKLDAGQQMADMNVMGYDESGYSEANVQ
jgi:hypothetical protein